MVNAAGELTKINIPPLLGDGTFQYHDTQQIQGPRKISDKLGATNPMVTDHVGTSIVANPNPLNTNVGDDDPQISGLLNHAVHKKKSGGPLFMSNEVFVDGHVEGVEGTKLRPRFTNSMITFWR